MIFRQLGISQADLELLARWHNSGLDYEEKTPNYKPEGVLAAMVFSVLLLNFFMLGGLSSLLLVPGIQGTSRRAMT